MEFTKSENPLYIFAVHSTFFWLVFFFFPLTGFSQSSLEKISLLNGKVELLVPADLSNMSDKDWNYKYQNKPRPTMVLTDASGAVNLIASMTAQESAGIEMTEFIDMQADYIVKKRSEIKVLGKGVKDVNGRKIGYFKFISKAIDQNIFNYFFFVAVDGKIMLFTFNCIEKLQSHWETTADQILVSVKIK